jgi:hypothetical protein
VMISDASISLNFVGTDPDVHQHFKRPRIRGQEECRMTRRACQVRGDFSSM